MTHGEPLSEQAVTALFGPGDAARRVLFDAWYIAASALYVWADEPF